MRKIAFILGKQGSGKTTRVCYPAIKAKKLWKLLRLVQFNFEEINISFNTFNHIEFGNDASINLIAGVHENFRRQSITELPSGISLIELPHSGYMPENINLELTKVGIISKIFLLELREQEWLSIGGETGNITSPEYFKLHGRSLSQRNECNYQKDTQLIRQDVSKSGIPYKIYNSADVLLRSLKRWIIFGF